jgi:hypothetical protein
MPRFGLVNAGEHVAAVGNRETSRPRIGGNNEPAVPSPSNPDERFSSSSEIDAG